MQTLKYIFLSAIGLFLIGCGGVDPKIQQQHKQTMNSFNNLIVKNGNYICKAKLFSPQSSYKRAKAQGKVTNDGTVTFVFDFKNYPNNVNVECKDQSYTWCDNDLYDKFTQRHHTSIKIQDNTIKPVHDKYNYDFYDTQIKILNVKNNQVDIYMNGTIEERDHVHLTMICQNPLQQIQQVAKIKTLKSSPYSDEVLLKKLDKFLTYKPSPQKYNKIKKLVEYGVYISDKSLYKALGVGWHSFHATYYPDYRVLKLLQINSGINDKELFSSKFTQKFLQDKESAYWMIEHAVDDSVYGNNEYERMNGYAFAEYFAKLGIFNKELIQLLKQNLSSTSSLKFSQKLKEKLYKNVFAKGDENKLIELALYNMMVDPDIVLPYTKQILDKSSTNHTKQMNLFLIKYLGIKSYKIDTLRTYMSENDYTLLNANRYNKNSYRYKYKNPQTYFPKLYALLQAFMKNATPDKVTAELYGYIKEHRFRNINNTSKEKILALLNTKNTAQKAKAQEYHNILEKMVHNDDERGAKFYLKKGAIGDPRIMMEALQKNMDGVAQTIALQNIHFDPKSVVQKSLELEKYDFVTFLLKHNKLPKKVLPYSIYKLLKTNTPQALHLADSMNKYGADTSKAFMIAKKNYDERTLKRIVKRYPTKRNAKLYKTYLKEQARIKKERQEAQRRARIAKQKEQEALHRAYMAKKHVGEKVCKDGRMALFLNITISGYVENIRGENIQIRITNTEGTSPHYNGTTLYPNKIIWDKYHNWRNCN